MTSVLDPTPDPDAVLRALDDETCQRLLRHLDEPKTAGDLRAEVDISESTLYRKLDRLADGGLVDEQVEIRSDGRHATRYVRSFDGVQIHLTDTGDVDVTIEDREPDPSDRLSSLWREVQQET